MYKKNIPIYSSDIPTILKKSFHVKYLIGAESWNKLANYIDSESKTVNIKLMLKENRNIGNFFAFFPEEVKNLSDKEINNLIEYFKDNEDFLKGGYIQVFLEKFTDKPYCKAFLNKIGKNSSFFYNNYPYNEKNLFIDNEEEQNRFSLPGKFCKSLEGEYNYENKIDWDFSKQIGETKRLHTKDNNRIVIDTPYKAYKVYAKKEYSKFLIGYELLQNATENTIIKISKLKKEIIINSEKVSSIKDKLKNEKKLCINPAFILTMGLNDIIYKISEEEHRYQLENVLKKVNKQCGTNYLVDDFDDFLKSLNITQEIKYSSTTNVDIIRNIQNKNELIKAISTVNEKDFKKEPDIINEIDKVLKTCPEEPEPYSLDDKKIEKITIGIQKAKKRIIEEIKYENQKLPLTIEECEIIKKAFAKFIELFSLEEREVLEKETGHSITRFSIKDKFDAISSYKRDSKKDHFYKELYSTEEWNYIREKIEKPLDSLNQNYNDFGEIHNPEIYKQKEVVEKYIDFIEPRGTFSEFWNNLRNVSKHLFEERKSSNGEPFNLCKEFANNLHKEYWNAKHSWDKLFNQYKELNFNVILYSKTHFNAILDYVYSKLMDEKKSPPEQSFKRFMEARKYKNQINDYLQEYFPKEKETNFVNNISNVLDFLLEVVRFHNLQKHIDYNVFLEFIENFAECGYETYFYSLNINLGEFDNSLEAFYKDNFNQNLLDISKKCRESVGD